MSNCSENTVRTGVLGAGTMGPGIALVAASAGCSVKEAHSIIN